MPPCLRSADRSPHVRIFSLGAVLDKINPNAGNAWLSRNFRGAGNDVLTTILSVLLSLATSGAHNQRSATPDIQVLFQELQETTTTNEATVKLAKLGRENRTAREYLAVHLPPLIENLPALAAKIAPGAVRADVAGNVIQLAGDVKLREAVPALVKVLPKDEPGGSFTMGSWERLENDPIGKVLAKIGDASVIPVSRLLGDPDSDTRWRAALILLNIGSPVARRALRSHIPKEQDPNLRERLIHDVGSMRSKQLCW